jgi:SAM-dependent methyltransferase
MSVLQFGIDLGMISGYGTRRNLAESFPEYWRPTVFLQGGIRVQRFISNIRLLFDLGAATMWRDLSREVPGASGTVLDAQSYRRLLPYIAVDTSEAGKHFGYEAPDTLYFSGDCWPVGDKSVDLVLCSAVLEYVSEPGIFLSEMYRCLRPSGRVILTVPFASGWRFIPYDYWRDTRDERGSFKNVVVHARGNPLTVACYRMMTLLLPLLFPQAILRFVRVFVRRLLGILALPVVVLLAIVANLSFGMEWGNDCLGYTVSVVKNDI